MCILTHVGGIRGIILKFASEKKTKKNPKSQNLFWSINQTLGKQKEQNINVVEAKLNLYEAVALFPKFRSPATTKCYQIRNSVSKYNSHYKCSKERIQNFKNADFRWLLSSGFQQCKLPKEVWKLSLGEEAGCAGPIATPESAAAGLPAQRTLPRWHRQAAPRWEHGNPGYSLTRAGQEAPKARPDMGVMPEHLRAEPGTHPRGRKAVPAPGEGAQCWQRAFKATSSSIPGLTLPLCPLPCPVTGSCHLNYNICNCANSS